MAQPSFVNDVPTEIWAEVFQHAHKKSLVVGAYDQTKFTRRDVPISVSQVCERFRQIAMNTPRLWTTIAVDFSAPNPNSTLSLTNLWLERSKNSPLSVFIHDLNGLDLERQSEKRECVTALLSHIGRWREATIEWTETDSNFWSSMGIVNHARLLETLILKPTVDEDEITKGLLPSMLWASSPNFRKLVVVLSVVVPDVDEFYPPDDGYSTWTMSNSIPYEQITHLRLDAYAYEIISCEEVASIFQRAENLVCCFIEGISDPDYWFDEQDPSPVLLNHLRHLYLEPADDGVTQNDVSISRLLELITAPALVSLTFVGESDFYSDSYKAFIRRSSCPLEELNLIHTDVGLYGTQACMESVSSSLRRLHVDRLNVSRSRPSEGDSNQFVSSMTKWDSATDTFDLCPNLEQVSLSPFFIDMVGHKEPPGLSLITPILDARLRRPAGGSGRFKTLLIPSKWETQVRSNLRELCEEPLGLRIASNDDMVNEELRSTRIWQRLAYEWYVFCFIYVVHWN